MKLQMIKTIWGVRTVRTIHGFIIGETSNFSFLKVEIRQILKVRGFGFVKKEKKGLKTNHEDHGLKHDVFKRNYRN